MGDNQGKEVSATVSEPETPQNANEPAKVEITVEPEKVVSPANSPPNVPTPQTKGNNPPTPGNTEDLSQLTPAIVEALSFDPANKSEQELRVHNVKLQGLQGRVNELLKEKTSVCTTLEKQNNALMIQTNSLKDVVAITKDLLSIRNMEVEHLHVDIKSMEEKINHEWERHNNMIDMISEAVKLNENLKTECQSQLQLFMDLRASYEKVSLLEAGNKRLSGAPAALTEAKEGDVQLTLEAISPPPQQ